jgi:hypothetical protein
MSFISILNRPLLVLHLLRTEKPSDPAAHLSIAPAFYTILQSLRAGNDSLIHVVYQYFEPAFACFSLATNRKPV